MATQIYLKHPVGIVKKACVGWSWTVFFFGFFPPLFRGDFKWFGIGLLIAIVNLLLSNVGIGVVTTLIWWIVFAAKYNEWHRNDLLLSGFQVVDGYSSEAQRVHVM